MRNVINTTANVTTTAIVNRPVRSVMAGVDGVRASLHHLRLYTAPAAKRWGQFAGKQQPAGAGPVLGSSDELSRCSRRASSRRRRSRVSSCLARS